MNYDKSQNKGKKIDLSYVLQLFYKRNSNEIDHF